MEINILVSGYDGIDLQYKFNMGPCRWRYNIRLIEFRSMFYYISKQYSLGNEKINNDKKNLKSQVSSPVCSKLGHAKLIPLKALFEL